MLAIAPIVEGHGEVEAVPLLIRRVAAMVAPELQMRIPRPIRVKRDDVVKTGQLERAIELAARQSGSTGAVFILLDADDCPAQLAPSLLLRVKNNNERMEEPSFALGKLLVGRSNLRLLAGRR